jgi:hypothetical protein
MLLRHRGNSRNMCRSQIGEAFRDTKLLVFAKSPVPRDSRRHPQLETPVEE